MVTDLEQGPARTAGPANPPDWPDVLPRTKKGELKQKLSWDEKLRVLDPFSPREATEARLARFESLFAFRYTDAIITKVNQGPRAWTALRGRLRAAHIVRHFLADRVPTLPPQWVGARSFRTTRHFCLDVDTDRTPEQVLALEYDLSQFDELERDWLLRKKAPKQRKSKKAKAPFEDRCQQVENALRLLGINPGNPRHLLIQPTPSGGRHYYIFLSASYDLDKMTSFWAEVGLHHVPGQFEFFPSGSHALRLPFGLIPGQPHDPRAWIQFTDDYDNHRIRRFSLQELLDHASRSLTAMREQERPSSAAASTSTTTTKTKTRVPGTSLPMTPMGIPKRERQAAALTQAQTERYRKLTEHGPRSYEEGEELKALGILLPGTRNTTLNYLAAHLVWFRELSPADATAQLTAWAYDPRHASKDIRHDLEHGTTRVASQIARMCRWYGEHRQDRPKTSTARPVFAHAELAALRPHIQALPAQARTGQAHFVLSFLQFAKLHGAAAEDGTAWEAAPAIKPVVRRWQGCHHMRYKDRMKRAQEAGIFAVVKEKYQAPPGQKGRARTYRLSVPFVPSEEWTLGYDDALAFLTGAGVPPADAPGGLGDVPALPTALPRTEERIPTREPPGIPVRPDGAPEPGDHTSPVHPPRSRAGTEPGPRERDPEPAEAVGVPREAPGAGAALPAPAHPGPAGKRFRTWTGIRNFEVETVAELYEPEEVIVRQLLANPDLPPIIRGVLEKAPERLSEAGRKIRSSVIWNERERRAMSLGPADYRDERGWCR